MAKANKDKVKRSHDTSKATIQLETTKVSMSSADLCNNADLTEWFISEYNKRGNEIDSLQEARDILQNDVSFYSKLYYMNIVCSGVNVMLTIALGISINIYTNVPEKTVASIPLGWVIVFIGIALFISNIGPIGYNLFNRKKQP